MRRALIAVVSVDETNSSHVGIVVVLPSVVAAVISSPERHISSSTNSIYTDCGSCRDAALSMVGVVPWALCCLLLTAGGPAVG